MEVRVDEVDGLPAHTYVSVRYGDQRRQAPFRSGEVISFHPGAGAAAGEKAPRSYTVDILRKVGTKQVSLAGITALGGSVKSPGLEIPSLEINGSPITADLTAKLVQVPPPDHDHSKRQQIARKAKEYMDSHKVQPVLNDMFAQLLEAQPSDPLAFMVDFLEQQRENAEASECDAHNYAIVPGLGNMPLPGFADGHSSEDLPDLSRHCSLAADALKEEPQLYERLRDLRTELGVSLAQCAKPGIDCPGHALMKVAGAFAGDAESYDTYWDFFGPIVSSLHPGWAPEVPHTMESNPLKLTNSRIDATGRYAIYATLDVRRNLRGFRFPPCCSKAERREVERILNLAANTGAETGAPIGVRGTYLPLRFSESHAPRRGGMTPHQQQRLRAAGMLFSEPDSRMRLSAGLGRDWPDARGVFLSESEGLCIWCNEEDHLRFFARQHATIDLKRLWHRLAKTVAAVDAAALALQNAQLGGEGEQGRSAFAFSERLGYITTCPTRLGAALRITVALKVPLLAAAVDLPALCASMDLQVSHEVGHSGSVWNVSSGDGLGVSEIDLLNGVIEGCSTLVKMEERLERGEPIYEATPGLGAEALPGFPNRRCPVAMPELGEHRSVVAQVLREEPGIYAKLRKKVTASGGAFAACIKPGMDDSGAISAGVVACDEACYEAFQDLFDPVLRRLNDGFLPSVPQPRDATAFKVTNHNIDSDGSCAVSVCVELRRNLKGLRFSPGCSLEERREVERLVTKALLFADSPCDIRYAPLAHSKSFALMPGGVPEEEQKRLQEGGCLFGAPERCEQLAAGLGRHWPDARGAVLSDDGADFSVWCNEEDHVRLRVQRPGADVKGALERALSLAGDLAAGLGREGAAFAEDARLGFLTVDPAHLGAALQCTVTLRAPNLRKRPELQAVGEALHLRILAGGGGDESSLRVATGPSLGVSEVDMANELIDGCANLVELERLLGGDAAAAEAQLRRLLG